MRIFNLAEELEKERKKNKELEFKVEDLKEQVEYQDLWRKEYLDRIDIAINYIEKIKEEYVLRYSDGIKFEDLEEINNLLDILKGDNK